MDLTDQRVLVVGASQGIGLAVAKGAAAAGAAVTIAGRSKAGLEAAAAGTALTPLQLDASEEAALAQYFDACEPIDHLVITTGGRVGPLPLLGASVAEVQDAFEQKFWTQYRCAKFAAPKIRAGGSITLTSGAASRRPLAGLAWLSALNAGLEALGRALAVELSSARIRVNIVCPGVVDTAVWDLMSAEQKQAFLETVGARLLVGRVAQPEDLAASYLFLMTSPYSTGSVIDVDGGAAVLPAR
jgi:NAD(P)-dependent dehydrogenase (short-subunit alcohol dehydrogenase family)